MEKSHEVTTLLKMLEENEEYIQQPEHIQSTHYDAEGNLEAWVQWKDRSMKMHGFE